MFQQDLVARLRADVTLSGLLGRKNGRPALDWVSRPDGASLPSVTLTEVSTAPIYTQGGRCPSSEIVVQFDAWGATVLETLSALDRIIEIMEMETIHGSTFFFRAFLSAGPRTMRAEDLPGGERVHRRSADLSFYHKPV